MQLSKLDWCVCREQDSWQDICLQLLWSLACKGPGFIMGRAGMRLLSAERNCSNRPAVVSCPVCVVLLTMYLCHSTLIMT